MSNLERALDEARGYIEDVLGILKEDTFFNENGGEEDFSDQVYELERALELLDDVEQDVDTRYVESEIEEAISHLEDAISELGDRW